MEPTGRMHPLVFHPPQAKARPRLARLGDWMAAHRRVILAVQWVIVLFYAVLVVVPALLPHPHPEARVFSDNWGASSYVDAAPCASLGDALSALVRNDKAPSVACWHDRLVLLAQYLFWGVWWPFVILSIMLMGRVWCGVLCPEGALSEWASRHGRGGAIPRWMRWAGWPFVAFVLTTVYGQLISVYEYPQAALLILGGSTVAAIAVGWLYGRGKRVWCRFLCPVTGVFALLARLAPVHFRVDAQQWRDFADPTPAVDCAPLLNVKKLASMSQCHSCGRCSGHRDAVVLTTRSPHAEILHGEMPRRYDIALLLFGMLGVAVAAFQWTVNPWFVAIKQASAGWLVEHDHLWLLGDSPAWWILTRQPALNDTFTWLDGALILGWILGGGLLLGGAAYVGTRSAARLARVAWKRLALGWIPLAGIGLFLGLSMMTVTDLRSEGLHFAWLGTVRALVLAGGWSWTAWLGWRLLGQPLRATPTTRALAWLLWILPVSLVALNWVCILFVW